jgi:hypothetical protein
MNGTPLIPFIEKWCQEIGWHSQNFPSLVRLLKTVGFDLFIEYGINWLFDCLSRIDHEESVLQKVSFSFSELLSKAWLKYSEEIKRDPKKMRRFVFMVDKLANHGDPCAIRCHNSFAT